MRFNLVTSCEIYQRGFKTLIEIENTAQNIMDKLEIDHEISASEYLNAMEWNGAYQKYIESAFGENLIYPGLFWETLACMNGREVKKDKVSD